MSDAIFVLGGARSGKSAHAQRLVEALGERRLFIATAQAFDAEMEDRIRRHQADRTAGWETVEAPVDLAEAIRSNSGSGVPLLVDCLTLWLSNLLLADADLETASAELASVIADFDGPLVIVSNEVGFGIVPDNALARRFRDAAGRLNQQVAAAAAFVDLVVAGMPVRIKGAS
ncbi:bifunctional adenosylcobinamide kinase/adenosylcobinamide-phosphate guanylyltransferase [Sandaracinobacteroides hominis]|uniref:bifunctional adenosylcobinamide kinase/adenosylcobinamide-phosphate guanylyltransferase n=1 Tax=Sandaracinobacteroides hominis TaxID=2780086 RepID=UPI0018F6F5D3|nr:bifunctional adenosylcobinamide kinase/adenosylcobinamide-phosphate guanylyltransferase [Sandaracinobacteroides hominis]